MNIVILTTKFSTDPLSPWLTNELAETLNGDDHNVQVLCLDWAASNGRGTFVVNGVTVHNYPAISLNYLPGSLAKLIKWVVSSFLAHHYFITSIAKNKFDVMVAFSPCIAVWYCLLKLKKITTKSVVVYWDFFPIHNYEIGKIRSKFLMKPAFLIEKYLLSKFNSVGCMSEMNVSFFKNYFSLGSVVKVFELPVWGRRSLHADEDGTVSTLRVRCEYEKLAVFGGQLEHGRGIDTLLRLAKDLKTRNADIALVIAGDGPLKSLVIEAEQDGLHNLIYLGQLPRDKYVEFIRTCDIGIVSTQTNVSVPTYPSKCVDYLLAPLPIIAIVEASTDFGRIIQDSGCGLLCGSDRVDELASMIIQLAANDLLREKMRHACINFFDQRHDVANVAKKLLNELIIS